MLSAKERLAQLQKSSNPSASNESKFGQAGLKSVSKNGGPAKPAGQASKVEPTAKPAGESKSTPAASVKPGEQPKAASKPAPAGPAKPADQAGKQDEKSSKQNEQPKPVQPGKQEAPKNPVPAETSKPAVKPAEQPKPAVGKPAETPKSVGATKPAEQVKPVETAKPTGQPKTTEQPKPIESKPAEPAKPTGASKPAEQPKQAEPKPAETAKQTGPLKTTEQPKPAEPKPVEQAKAVEQPKAAEPSKPSQQPKPAEQPKPADQSKPKQVEQAKEQPKIAEPTKVVEQPKPTEQPKPAPTTANPPKPSEVTNQPASTASKPSDPKVEPTKVAEPPKLQATPASQLKPGEQQKPALSTAQAKPAEPVKPEVVTQPGTSQVKAPEVKSTAPTAAAKVVPDQPSKIPVATGQTNLASVTKTEQPHASVSVKVETAKTADPKPVEAVQKPADVPKASEASKPAATPTVQPSKPGEAQAACSDEVFANIFYFSGMGNLIGSALAEGIYVPEKNHSSALELEDIESLRKREEEKRKHEIINVARNQAQGLFGDFQKLQALLEGLPTFTDTLEPKPLERRAVDQPIHGHIYFQQEQHSRPHSQVHQSGHDNAVTHRQTTTYTTSQVIQPSANTTKIGFDRSPEDKSTVSTVHIVPSHLNETASPSRVTHHTQLGGYDRLAAKQASLAHGLADRDAFNRTHGNQPGHGGAQNPQYQTVESQFYKSRHEGGHHGAGHVDDAQRQLTGGTLDTTDLKPWQLSHLRGLEARGYHLESHSHSPTHHKQTTTSSSYTSYASPSLPYCDL